MLTKLGMVEQLVEACMSNGVLDQKGAMRWVPFSRSAALVAFGFWGRNPFEMVAVEARELTRQSTVRDHCVAVATTRGESRRERSTQAEREADASGEEREEEVETARQLQAVRHRQAESERGMEGSLAHAQLAPTPRSKFGVCSRILLPAGADS